MCIEGIGNDDRDGIEDIKKISVHATRNVEKRTISARYFASHRRSPLPRCTESVSLKDAQFHKGKRGVWNIW